MIQADETPVTVMQIADKKPRKVMSGLMPPHSTIRFKWSCMTFN